VLVRIQPAMVRGNWQHRVERVEARRQEAKDKKRRSEDKRVYKQWGQQLLDYLNTSHSTRENGVQENTLHIWTTTFPTEDDTTGDAYLDDKGGGGGGGVKPSNQVWDVSMLDDSLRNDATTQPRKSRSRSNSLQNDAVPVTTTKKKVHPRSKEVMPDTTVTPRILMCRSHFFSGNCANCKNTKKSTCRYKHYSLPYRTLASILGDGQYSGNVIARCENAVIDASMPPDTMDMLHYMQIDLKQTGTDGTYSEYINDNLTKFQVPLSSLVYVSLNNQLLYDRNQEGMAVLDSEFSSQREVHNVPGMDDSQGSSSFFLPGPILEHVLAYLPDHFITVLSLVCKEWNSELAHGSSKFWQTALQNRNWPYDDVASEPNNNVVLRQMFIKHYCATRDAGGIRHAVAASQQHKTDRDIVYQDFSKFKHAPSHPNACVALEVWAKNQVLAAYSQDCSLRLFENNLNLESGLQRCKEVAYLAVDPYRHTKKRSCMLLSMALDRDFIGCLCEVSRAGINIHTYIMTLISREDFLLCPSSETTDTNVRQDPENLTVVDVGEAVLNFLLCSEDTILCTFLADGGEIGSIDVHATGNISTCGYGRFMIEVAISLPMDDMVEAIQSRVTVVARKLVMYSAGANTVVWIGDSAPLARNVMSELGNVYVASKQSGMKALFAAGAGSHPTILIGEVFQKSSFQEGTFTLSHHLPEAPHGFTLRMSSYRALAAFSDSVVSAEVWKRHINVEDMEWRCTISFYRRSVAEDGFICKSCPIAGVVDVYRLFSLREEHMALLCSLDASNVMPADAAANIVADGWFESSMTLGVIIFHVKSGREIKRLPIDYQFCGSMRTVPLVSVDGSTMGIAVTSRGIALSGEDVYWSQRACMGMFAKGASLSPSKRVKQKQPKSKNKKDGFARGMSLRG
jgi:hypothetical protein